MTAAHLYDANGKDREVSLDEGMAVALDKGSLLWVEVDRSDRKSRDSLVEEFKLDPRTFKMIGTADGPAQLDNFGHYLQLRVFAPPQEKGGKRDPGGRPLDFVIGDNWLVTVHDGSVEFFDRFRDQDKAETQIGNLSAPALAASLLDWHLGAFFDALADIEDGIDRLDEKTLGRNDGDTHLSRVVGLRRRVSRLRSVLSAQRGVFYGLARPDFALTTDDPAALDHLRGLAQRFDRAIDEVEHGRDLVASSFDLFASRTAQDTNELVKVLTFVTVITGVFAAVAGLMGMNFKAALFDTGNLGFFAVTAGLFAASVIAAFYARRRKWL